MSGMKCAVCSGRGWWAHHVKSVGSGGRDLYNVVPLCVHHHTEVETSGRKSFEAKHNIDLSESARRIGIQSPFATRAEDAERMGTGS